MHHKTRIGIVVFILAICIFWYAIYNSMSLNSDQIRNVKDQTINEEERKKRESTAATPGPDEFGSCETQSVRRADTTRQRERRSNVHTRKPLLEETMARGRRS